MVATQRTLDALKTIGLNKYERNLWVALLSRGASTAGELSDISNVPRSRCYDVLESLADKGFVMVQTGKPLRYVAIEPQEALDRAKKHITEYAEEVNEKIERLMKTDAMKELDKLHKNNIKVTKPEAITGALKGRYAMVQQMATMMKNAKKSVKILTTEDGLKEIADKHKLAFKKAAASGVKIQILAPITKNNEFVLNELGKHASIRDVQDSYKVQKILGRMCVVDGSELVLGITDDEKTHETQDVSMWTQSEHVSVNMFEPIFNMLWNTSKQVPAKQE